MSQPQRKGKAPTMVDMTDDWMNPKPMTWETPKVDDKDEFLIERARKVVCFGNPGYIIEWDFWSKHDTKAERDAALVKLSEEHPMWHLRARDRNPWLEQHGIYRPESHPGINS
jgi:hypothetical protein